MPEAPAAPSLPVVPGSPTTTDELVTLLVPIWSTVLRVQANADSDFIALGGDSQSAVAIAGAVVERCGRPDGFEAVALRAVFESATLQAMAEALAAFLGERAAPPVST